MTTLTPSRPAAAAPTAIRVFDATTDEHRSLAGKLRYDVYVKELGKAVPGENHEAGTVFDAIDAHSEILCLERDGRVVGTIRNTYAADHVPAEYALHYGLDDFADIPKKEIAVSSHLVIAGDQRGSSAIGALLTESYIRARKRGVRYTFLSCTPCLIPLYETLGFRIYKRGIFNSGISQQVPMLLVMDDLEHLKSASSPLARTAGGFPARSLADDWFANRFPEYRIPSSHRVAGPEAFLAQLSWSLMDEEGTIFAGMDAESRNQLLGGGSIVNAADGDHVVRSGEAGRELFVVLDGMVEIVRYGASGVRLVLRNIGAGQVFGEVAFVHPIRRSADAVSVGSTRLLCVTRESMMKLMTQAPQAAAPFLLNLSQVLAERLAATTQMLQDNA